MAFLSKNLQRLLQFEHTELDHEIDLVNLAQKVADAFGNRAEEARQLFANVSGTMMLSTLGVHMLQLLRHDSAVRDIQTTGHLAKLLSRLDVFRKTSDYRIVGMPNPLFDELSQSERVKYFETAQSLELENELLESPDARAMMDRESRLLGKSSSNS